MASGYAGTPGLHSKSHSLTNLLPIITLPSDPATLPSEESAGYCVSSFREYLRRLQVVVQGVAMTFSLNCRKRKALIPSLLHGASHGPLCLLVNSTHLG